MVKKEFGNFSNILEKTHKKIQEAGNTIEQAMTRNRVLERKLNKVTDNDVLLENEENDEDEVLKIDENIGV